MSRRPVLAVLAFLAALVPGPAAAHVGSPNVFFDGDAGPYPVRVIVRPPEVVPGVAEITVRLQSGAASRVAVQPVYWQAGLEGAPPADVAVPVPGQAGSYTAQLWLMRQGSYTVRVEVDGSSGPGVALVPVTTAPTKVRGMQKGVGIALTLLGVFLFAGALTIVGAAVRESALAPGEVPDPRRKARARFVAGGSGLLLALLLYGGKRWWDRVDAETREGLYRPFAVETSARAEGGRRVLSMVIDDARRAEWSPLIPDHGKLMHMFLVREPGLDAFAHLHPVPREQDRFDVTLPPLPAGRYRVYGDVVHETGFPQTLVDEVDIPAAPDPSGLADAGSPPPDPDDSWRASAPVARAAGPAVSPLGGGFEMSWRKGPEPLAAGRELDLRFEVRGPGGRPAALEPYMGMLSHAVITRDDGEVFVHLHPVGSFSMASKEAFEKRLAPAAAPSASSAPAMDHGAHVAHAAHGPSVVSFPYEFPRPGRYRIWVQVKSGGKVMTGVFDAEVRAAS